MSGYSALLISSYSQAVALIFFFRGTTGQLQTPEPKLRPLHATDQSQVAMTLRLGCIVFAPQFCRCLVAVTMWCGYTYHLYRVEPACDISFWCKSLSKRSTGFLILWCPNVYQRVSRCEDQQGTYTWDRIRRNNALCHVSTE